MTQDEPSNALLFPTESEIYILADGTVVFADLPAELSALSAQLGSVQSCHIESQFHSQASHPLPHEHQQHLSD